MKLSIVMPCYNERLNLPELLLIISEMGKYSEIEFIIVENGSTDGSREYLRTATTGMDNVRIVEIDKNQGYGYGIKMGLDVASGQYIGWTHGDLQLDIRDIVKAYHYLERTGWTDEYFIKGKRESKERHLSERFCTWGMGKWVSFRLNEKMVDINGQPNIFPKSFYEKLDKIPNDVTIEVFVYYMAKRMKLNVKRFVVKFMKRKNGESKLSSTFLSRFRAIKLTMRYTERLRGLYD